MKQYIVCWYGNFGVNVGHSLW